MGELVGVPIWQGLLMDLKWQARVQLPHYDAVAVNRKTHAVHPLDSGYLALYNKRPVGSITL